MATAIYECIDCEMNYCSNCDGGEDSCVTCSSGPRCDDCAVEHGEEEHKRCWNCGGSKEKIVGCVYCCRDCGFRCDEGKNDEGFHVDREEDEDGPN